MVPYAGGPNVFSTTRPASRSRACCFRPLTPLQDSFRAQLDEALIRAIASDHDLETPTGYEAAQQTLQALAEDVAAEEAVVFSHSNGGIDALGSPVDASPRPFVQDGGNSTSTSSRSQQASAQHTDSSHTDMSTTNVAAATTASPSLAPGYSVPCLTPFDEASEVDKIAQLREMFADLKEIDVKTAMKKANGDFQGALDDLLNVQYLESTGQRQRGVEGFFRPEDDDVEDDSAGKGKKRGKKRPKNKSKAETTRPKLNRSNSSKDHIHSDEIAFLADRIDLSYDDVSTIYYNKKCSRGAAAVHILDQFIEHGIKAQDDESKARAKALASRYLNIPEHYLPTLVQVTGTPETQYADDIADLLSRHFARNPWTQRIDLVHRITPLPHEELESGMASVGIGGRTSQISGTKSPRPTPAWNRIAAPTKDLTQVNYRLDEAKQSQREASSQATQLYRRGASHSLYKQAAHVYRERAQQHGAHVHELSSTAADALVDQQSTRTTCDLHGVYVQDGVRIAKQRVWAWWRGLGEFSARAARDEPFTVITGLGRHSVGGVSRLRRAVVPALLEDGWRFQVGTGSFVIFGRL